MILVWYTAKRFLSTFLFTLLAMCLLFVIIDLFEHLENFLGKNIRALDVVWYYLIFLPYIAKLLIPVSSLLAALFSVGRLAAGNELTAMRAAGMGYIRFLLPYLVLASGISVGQVWFNGWIVPQANSAKLQFERELLLKGGGGTLTDLRFRDSATRNISIGAFNEEQRTARMVAIEEFGDPLRPRLKWRLEAPVMRWYDNRGWVADSARKRTYGVGGQDVTWHYNVSMPFTIPAEQIRSLQRTPDELSFDQLPAYVATQRAGGKDTRRQEVEYYAGWSFPFANLIVVLIAVPFAAVRRKGGTAVNIATAMIVAFSYIVFSEVVKAVGIAQAADPVVVGWTSNAVFAAIALLTTFVFRR